MFFKTEENNQLSIFSAASSFLSGRSLREYASRTAWHNQFRVQVTYRIDEEIFRPLFCADNGASNSSIRVLIGMMVLKEAQGWSDAQLFEACRYNLLVRSALGLHNLDDTVSSESTYYLLRKRVVEWEKAHNENLIELAFSQITKSQIVDFEINGKQIRLDSKLLGSNIAWYSRYELVHEALRAAYPFIKSALHRLSLCESEVNGLENIVSESGNKVSYRSNKAEIESKMAELGVLIGKIISRINDDSSEEVQTLRRVFSEQYIVNEADITPRAKAEISASSVQSPHDTDCTYRDKDGNRVKGYSINLTETCSSENPLNLITNVLVDVASAADCDFLQPAIEASQEILPQKIEIVNADGAYHSPENQDYCTENTIDFVLGAIQGKPPQYDLSLNEGELIVTDLKTNEIIPTTAIKSRKKDIVKWRIVTANGQYRYFSENEINTCLLRKNITKRTKEELNVRNNVESTVFQLGYHYPNDKSRYRGLSKHKIWANLRCLWVNFSRILKFIVQNGSIFVKKVKNTPVFPHFSPNFVETAIAIRTDKNFCYIGRKK